MRRVLCAILVVGALAVMLPDGLSVASYRTPELAHAQASTGSTHDISHVTFSRTSSSGWATSRRRLVPGSMMALAALVVAMTRRYRRNTAVALRATPCPFLLEWSALQGRGPPSRPSLAI
jgi:3-polyprenyl-4-hydroxybenzoate decarboxylase